MIVGHELKEAATASEITLVLFTRRSRLATFITTACLRLLPPWTHGLPVWRALRDLANIVIPVGKKKRADFGPKKYMASVVAVAGCPARWLQHG